MTTFYNRAWMTTATTGTGTITLGSARAGYYSFADAGVPNAAQVRYEINDGDNVEIGLGTYTTSGTTLSRDTVLSSLIAGVKGTSKLNLSGSATVFLSIAAEDFGTNAFNSTVIPAAAVQADQETGASTTTFVSPGTQQSHPSGVKFWAEVTANGTTLDQSFNVTSKTDTGTGDLLVTIATDFSAATWCCLIGNNGIIVSGANNASSLYVYQGTKAAGTIQLLCKNGSAGTATDPSSQYSVAGLGDQ